MELGHDGRLAGIVHRGIAVFPIAHHAQALEPLLLDLDPVGGIGAALLAKLRLTHLVLAPPLAAQLFFDLPLDRQAVTVPAGHIVDVIAQREPRADDEVLQGLLQRVPDMNCPIGIGRPVMQHEQWRTLGLPFSTDGMIEPLGLPLGQDLGLQLGQTAAHGEGCVGKKYGLAVITRSLFGVVGHRIIQEVRIECGRAIPARAGTCPATSRRARNSRCYPNQGHGRAVAEGAPEPKPFKAPAPNTDCHPGNAQRCPRPKDVGRAG